MVCVAVRAVNLPDELYASEDPSDSDGTCDMDEFELMVGRLAREKIPESTEPLASTIEAFLTMVFVPKYRKLLKARGVVVPIAERDGRGRGTSLSLT